jgi:hypothetical protein
VSIRDEHDPHYQEDIKILHSMGYAQELSRRMGGFQNFAISFSIICILAGGIRHFLCRSALPAVHRSVLDGRLRRPSR